MESTPTELRAGFRDLLKVALPLIVTSASFTILNFCDRMFLAWYSPVALQAAVPAGILFFTLVCGFMALAAFSNSFVAQYYGAGEYRNCARATAQAIIMALGSWPLILALIPLGHFLLEVSGHRPDVLAAEKEYLTILQLGGVSVPLAAAATAFFAGRGRTSVVMAGHLVGNTCNVLLNWMLIFGRCGFPEMGIRGAAIASVVSGFVCPAIMLTLYFSPANHRVYQTRCFRFNAPLFWRMIRFGVPSGIHMALDLASFSFFVLMVGRVGETAFIASNIALSVNMLAFMPSIGIGQAVGTLVGQFQGRGDSDAAQMIARKGLWVSWGYTLIVNLSYLLMPAVYIRLFARGDLSIFDEIYPLTVALLFCAALWGVLEATNAVLSGALRGAGDTHFVMWYHTAVAWGVFVSGEALILLVFGGGAVAAWGWAVVYFLLLAAGFGWRFRSGRWKQIELIDRKPPLPEPTEVVPG
jgi:MATE family multidrug resistance protein